MDKLDPPSGSPSQLFPTEEDIHAQVNLSKPPAADLPGSVQDGGVSPDFVKEPMEFGPAAASCSPPQLVRNEEDILAQVNLPKPPAADVPGSVQDGGIRFFLHSLRDTEMTCPTVKASTEFGRREFQSLEVAAATPQVQVCPQKVSKSDIDAIEATGDDDDDDDANSDITTIEDTKRQLEQLQIQTIFSLVESVEVSGVKAKLLFLTNRQASELNLKTVEFFCMAMEIRPKPQFVINLIPSIATHRKGARGEAHWLGRPEYKADDRYCSEHDGRQGLERTDQHLTFFLRKVVYPLAVRTNALVLVNANDTCSLARAFGDICAREAKRNGGKLPFTLLSITAAEQYGLAADRPGSTANQIKRSSRRWRQSMKDITLATTNYRGPSRVGWIRDSVDLTAGCTHYIIVDSVHKDEASGRKTLWYEPWRSLARIITSQMGKELTNISIATFQGTWSYRAWSSLADVVASGLPLLLLDSYQWPSPQQAPSSISDAFSNLEQLGKQLVEKGCFNHQFNSILAYIHASFRNELAKNSARNKVTQRGMRLGHVLTVLRRNEEAIHNEMQEANGHAELERKLDARSVAEQLVQFLSAADLDLQRLRAEQQSASLNAVLQEIVACTGGLSKLDKILEKTLAGREPVAWAGRDADHADPDPFTALAEKRPDLFILRDVPHPYDKSIMVKIVGISQLDQWAFDLRDARDDKDRMQDITNVLQDAIQKEIARLGDQIPSRPPISSELFMSIIQLLESPLVYSGNIWSLDELDQTLARAARINRLPDGSRLQALELLKMAWDKVDVFRAAASHYKLVTKVLYIAVLFTTMCLSIVTVVGLNRPEYVPGIRLWVFMLTMLSGLLSTILTFLNPATKWQTLRGAHLALESEIWKFRTRTGAYGTSNSVDDMDSRSAEEALQSWILELTRHVLKSASVKENSFLSKFDGIFSEPHGQGRIEFRHGQHYGCRVDGTFGNANGGVDPRGPLIDDHHSPLTPENYIDLRVKPHFQFYQKRLPPYSRHRTVTETILNICLMSGTVLAFLDLATWSAIPAAVFAAVSAYSKFHGTDKKLQRFSDSISNIDSILIWWRALDVEKANPKTVAELVNRCEDAFQSERQSWVSTSLSNQLLAADDKDESKDHQKLQ